MSTVEIGAHYGPHLVIGIVEKRAANGEKVCRTECSHCGNIHRMMGSALRTAKRTGTKKCKDCVAFFREGQPTERVATPGERWGKWTVLDDLGCYETPVRRRYVRAKCSCGVIARLVYRNLIGGNSTRCLDCVAESSKGEKAHRRCVHCRRTREDGVYFQPNRANECSACNRRAARNGRCPDCRYPLRKNSKHACIKPNTTTRRNR